MKVYNYQTGDYLKNLKGHSNEVSGLKVNFNFYRLMKKTPYTSHQDGILRFIFKKMILMALKLLEN